MGDEDETPIEVIIAQSAENLRKADILRTLQSTTLEDALASPDFDPNNPDHQNTLIGGFKENIFSSFLALVPDNPSSTTQLDGACLRNLYWCLGKLITNKDSNIAGLASTTVNQMGNLESTQIPLKPQRNETSRRLNVIVTYPLNKGRSFQESPSAKELGAQLLSRGVSTNPSDAVPTRIELNFLKIF